MSIKHYDKLVRDKIPQIIESSGKSCTVCRLDDESYLRKVDEKLQEELAEYLESHAIEELADLCEVVRAAARALGYTIDDLERTRAEKARARGAFDERLLLVDVVDNGAIGDAPVGRRDVVVRREHAVIAAPDDGQRQQHGQTDEREYDGPSCPVKGFELHNHTSEQAYSNLPPDML